MLLFPEKYPNLQVKTLIYEFCMLHLSLIFPIRDKTRVFKPLYYELIVNDKVGYE